MESTYEKPEMKIVYLDTADIVRTSGDLETPVDTNPLSSEGNSIFVIEDLD